MLKYSAMRVASESLSRARILAAPHKRFEKFGDPRDRHRPNRARGRHRRGNQPDAAPKAGEKMRNRLRFGLSLCAFAACMVNASCAAAGPWGNPEYLYRYIFWGLRQEWSPSDAYKMFPYRTIETQPPPYQFPRATTGALPAEVEYKDGESPRRIALDQLLESSETHAFIVLKDGKLVDERYLNGYQRDSICI